MVSLCDNFILVKKNLFVNPVVELRLAALAAQDKNLPKFHYRVNKKLPEGSALAQVSSFQIRVPGLDKRFFVRRFSARTQVVIDAAGRIVF